MPSAAQEEWLWHSLNYEAGAWFSLVFAIKYMILHDHLRSFDHGLIAVSLINIREELPFTSWCFGVRQRYRVLTCLTNF